jgi:hypothetical protein
MTTAWRERKEPIDAGIELDDSADIRTVDRKRQPFADVRQFVLIGLGNVIFRGWAQCSQSLDHISSLL